MTLYSLDYLFGIGLIELCLVPPGDELQKPNLGTRLVSRGVSTVPLCGDLIPSQTLIGTYTSEITWKCFHWLNDSVSGRVACLLSSMNRIISSYQPRSHYSHDPRLKQNHLCGKSRLLCWEEFSLSLLLCTLLQFTLSWAKGGPVSHGQLSWRGRVYSG